ncbi:MAG: hypothetical protein RLZZ628_2284 [Bacteroidota bacterium]|jgi:hypothetical protein
MRTEAVVFDVVLKQHPSVSQFRSNIYLQLLEKILTHSCQCNTQQLKGQIYSFLAAWVLKFCQKRVIFFLKF